MNLGRAVQLKSDFAAGGSGSAAVGVFGVDAHVVVEDAVEAEVVETDFVLDGGELGLPVGAEAFVDAAGAYGVEGRGGVRAEGVGGIDGEGLWCLGEAGCGEAEKKECAAHGDERSRVVRGRRGASRGGDRAAMGNQA